MVTPVNKGKQSLVKHMVAIDWRSWNLYMRPSSERSITIRVVERLAALREMFKAKQGHGFAEFVSGEFMQTKFSLSKINTLPFKKEAKRIDLELVKVEEMEKPSSARNSLMDLNDASDEFFDVPEPNESYEFDSLIENSPFSQGHSQVNFCSLTSCMLVEKVKFKVVCVCVCVSAQATITIWYCQETSRSSQ